jgi:hypothetical protein
MARAASRRKQPRTIANGPAHAPGSSQRSQNRGNDRRLDFMPWSLPSPARDASPPPEAYRRSAPESELYPRLAADVSVAVPSAAGHCPRRFISETGTRHRAGGAGRAWRVRPRFGNVVPYAKHQHDHILKHSARWRPAHRRGAGGGPMSSTALSASTGRLRGGANGRSPPRQGWRCVARARAAYGSARRRRRVSGVMTRRA